MAIAINIPTPKRYAANTTINIDSKDVKFIISKLKDISKELAFAKYCPNNFISYQIYAKPAIINGYSPADFEAFVKSVHEYMTTEFLLDTYQDAFANEFEDEALESGRNICINIDFGWTTIRYCYSPIEDEGKIIDFTHKAFCPNTFFNKFC